MSDTEEYQLSGETGPRLIVVALCAVVMGVIVGWAVGILRFAVPYFMLRLAATGAVGWLLGRMLMWLVKRVHCRSRTAIIQISAVGILSAAYTSVVMHLWLVVSGSLSISFWNLMISPLLTWDLFHRIANSGMYSRRGLPVSALELYLLWGLEVAALLGLALRKVIPDVKKLAYCETCSRWLDVGLNSLYFKTPPGVKRSALMEGDLAQVSNLQHMPTIQIPGVRLDYDLCRSCGNSGAYNLVEVIIDRNNNPQDRQLSPLMNLNEAQTRHLGIYLAEREDWEKEVDEEALDTEDKDPIAGVPAKTGDSA